MFLRWQIIVKFSTYLVATIGKLQLSIRSFTYNIEYWLLGNVYYIQYILMIKNYHFKIWKWMNVNFQCNMSMNEESLLDLLWSIFIFLTNNIDRWWKMKFYNVTIENMSMYIKGGWVIGLWNQQLGARFKLAKWYVYKKLVFTLIVTTNNISIYQHPKIII